MKIEIELSEENEGTSEPWWVIIDARQNISCDIHVAASQITGPFFSRDEAQDVLDFKRHRFSSRAHVYCLSGYMTRQFKDAIRPSPNSKTPEQDVMSARQLAKYIADNYTELSGNPETAIKTIEQRDELIRAKAIDECAGILSQQLNKMSSSPPCVTGSVLTHIKWQIENLKTTGGTK